MREKPFNSSWNIRELLEIPLAVAICWTTKRIAQQSAAYSRPTKVAAAAPVNSPVWTIRFPREEQSSTVHGRAAKTLGRAGWTAEQPVNSEFNALYWPD